MANLWISFPRNLGYKTEHIHADFLECWGFVLYSKKKPNLDISYLSLFIHLAPSEVYALRLISLRLTIFDFIILLNCMIFLLTLKWFKISIYGRNRGKQRYRKNSNCDMNLAQSRVILIIQCSYHIRIKICNMA